METSASYATFDEAAEAVVGWLGRQAAGRAWLLARRHGDEWHVLAAADSCDGLRPGHVLVWAEPVRAMLAGPTGPHLVRPPAGVVGRIVRPRQRALRLPDLLVSPLIMPHTPVAAALIGIGRWSATTGGGPDSETLDVLSGLLGGLLQRELESADAARHNERFRHETMTDALTHLPDRAAWEEKLAAEQQRSRRLGEMSFVTVIAVAAHGDGDPEEGDPDDCETLRRAALTLRYAVRDQDFVARTGTHGFAVLGMQCGAIDEQHISARIHEALNKSGVSARVGTAASDPVHGHAEIWHRAQRAMQRAEPNRDRRGTH
jgi:diguanylate cyclase (GGDEF)-like protein